MKDVKSRIRTRDTMFSSPTLLPLGYGLQLHAESRENLWYLCTVLINVYVADHNDCNSTLTSGTNNVYPYPYIDVNDRGHHFRLGSPLTNYPHAPVPSEARTISTVELRLPQVLQIISLKLSSNLRNMHKFAKRINMKISIMHIIPLFFLQRTEACSFRLEPPLYILSRVTKLAIQPLDPKNLSS